MIKKVREQDIHRVVRFAAKMNQEEEKKSSFLSTKKSLIKKDFRELLSHENRVFLSDSSRFQIQGLMACFKHPHQDYMDCAGPFYRNPSVGKALIQHVIDLTLESQNMLFFFDYRHQELISMIEGFGGHLQGTESQLTLKRHQVKNLSSYPWIKAYNQTHQAWLREIHEDLFPESYISIEDIVSLKDTTRKTFLIFTKDVPVGYLILKTYPDFLMRKTIEMIGVKESYRHQGYGRALLSFAIKESFQDLRVSSVDLIVENINTEALNLYTHLGFEVSRKNVNMIIPKKR